MFWSTVLCTCFALYLKVSANPPGCSSTQLSIVCICLHLMWDDTQLRTNISLLKMKIQKRNGVSRKRTVLSTSWETRSTTWSCLCLVCTYAFSVGVSESAHMEWHTYSHIRIIISIRVRMSVHFEWRQCVCRCGMTKLIRKAESIKLVWSFAPGTSRQTHAVVTLLSCCSPYAHNASGGKKNGKRYKGTN